MIQNSAGRSTVIEMVEQDTKRMIKSSSIDDSRAAIGGRKVLSFIDFIYPIFQLDVRSVQIHYISYSILPTNLFK